MRAWFMDNNTTVDQREHHYLDPPEFVAMEYLDKLGVSHWKVINPRECNTQKHV